MENFEINSLKKSKKCIRRRWTKEEKKQLIESVERPHLNLKDVDWQSIAEMYEDRTPTSCQQKYYEIKRKEKQVQTQSTTTTSPEPSPMTEISFQKDLTPEQTDIANNTNLYSSESYGKRIRESEKSSSGSEKEIIQNPPLKRLKHNCGQALNQKRKNKGKLMNQYPQLNEEQIRETQEIQRKMRNRKSAVASRNNRRVKKEWLTGQLVQTKKKN